ncbi:M43 family zinc metalloprotease [Paraflavitalea speifideaquila]|uniref:M43 family zinc metalloprotease n=1 Tax=Paraflavitalea speifideaquila TaxID=3076558 RepID=UPI0028E3D637|nr:M43 family zinc metalloprotease [Paraflavitalea speifideiaquila]
MARATDGTLGIATFPNTGLPENQGIVLTLSGFGNNPAYVHPSFNKGRTAVHEAGHFFYARHIWGDGGGCQSDFPAVAGLAGFVDDTPTQSGATSGCPSGVVAAGCGSPNPPGKMYQNYMDYTDDACYCLFTLNQVARMEAALTLFRSNLLTSNGCQPRRRCPMTSP